MVATLKMKRTRLHKLANRAAEWEESDGLVYYQGKLYVPNNIEICYEILKQYYDSVTIEHLDYNLTLELVEHYYWWPLICVFNNKYIQVSTMNLCKKGTPPPSYR